MKKVKLFSLKRGSVFRLKDSKKPYRVMRQDTVYTYVRDEDNIKYKFISSIEVLV